MKAINTKAPKGAGFLALLFITAGFLTPASSQSSNSDKTAGTLKVINVWPGLAPGSEEWKQKETTLGSGPMQRIVNVTTPTLTAFLPDPAKATGTAVIIAP